MTISLQDHPYLPPDYQITLVDWESEAKRWRAHADALYAALISIAPRCQHLLQKDEAVQLMPCSKCAAIAEYEQAAGVMP